MAIGNYIDKNSLNVSDCIVASWYDQPNQVSLDQKTAYFYVSATCFTMVFRGNDAFAIPRYKVIMQTWNGTSWVDRATKNVEKNNQRFTVNCSAYGTDNETVYLSQNDDYQWIYRFTISPWTGWYQQYLGGEIRIHGLGRNVQYDKYFKGKKIYCIPERGYINGVDYDKKPLTEMSDFYGYSQHSGNPILDSTKKHRFIALN